MYTGINHDNNDNDDDVDDDDIDGDDDDREPGDPNRTLQSRILASGKHGIFAWGM